jgi:3-hydroxybutyryl-CoA dehydrogenase
MNSKKVNFAKFKQNGVTMHLSEIQTIAVIGSGIMGHGIAQSFVMNGYSVIMYDLNEAILETAKAHIQNSLELFRQADLITDADITKAMKRLTLTSDLNKAAHPADFIIEAAPEDLVLKQDLFCRIENNCAENVIIASNTSSLKLTDIGVRVKNKERLVITHWFNPPQLVPTVEVVKGEETSDDVLDVTYDLLTKIKKVPVKIHKELPGFLVNRIQIAMVREVLDLYRRGVASAADIDRAIKGSIGFRLVSIGPLITMDLGGLSLWLKVFENLLPEIQSATEPPAALQKLVDAGHEGIKSGKGFFDYGEDFSKGELEDTIKMRDQEFMHRLENLYWNGEKIS